MSSLVEWTQSAQMWPCRFLLRTCPIAASHVSFAVKCEVSLDISRFNIIISRISSKCHPNYLHLHHMQMQIVILHAHMCLVYLLGQSHLIKTYTFFTLLLISSFLLTLSYQITRGTCLQRGVQPMADGTIDPVHCRCLTRVEWLSCKTTSSAQTVQNIITNRTFKVPFDNGNVVNVYHL